MIISHIPGSAGGFPPGTHRPAARERRVTPVATGRADDGRGGDSTDEWKDSLPVQMASKPVPNTAPDPDTDVIRS